MAGFSPLDDYFGLNALVTRLNMSDTEILREDGEGSTQSPSVPSYRVATGLRKSATMEAEGTTLQDFDILKLSRVYHERLNNSTRRKRKPLDYCVFCKNNGEVERVFSSHRLRGENDVITCPILRAYTCPLCGCNGDKAHTIRYCPMNLSQQPFRQCRRM